MKRMLAAVCGVMVGSYVCAEPQPKAEIHLRITDDLPKLTGINIGYKGTFTVTNTGEVAFTVVTDENWSDANRFYQEGDGEWQRNIDESGMGKKWRDEERASAKRLYDGVLIKYPDSTRALQPGENISFEHKNILFGLPFSRPGGICKAEMYLGHDTWVPVHIVPTPCNFRRITYAEDFFYAKEGTNQYMYVRTEEGKFRRIGEMKLNSLPETKKGEDTVTFETPEGGKRKLTLLEAKQIIQEREQQNN